MFTTSDISSLTLGSQTGKPRLTVSGCFSSTGWGHFHCENTRKNLCTRVAGAAFGYSWQVRATNIAQDTPPKKPNALLYIPCSENRLNY